MSAVQLLTEHLALWSSADTEKKSGRGRASGNAASVYGIKKLRELILELAVRGKLVPQDANDEPASELLKCIQVEKAKLIAEGKIKHIKLLSEINDDEKLFELPSGWEWARLGDVAQINPRNDAEDKLEVSFVPMTLISTSHTGKHEQETRTWGELKKGFTHFAEGDVGVAKITPCFENSKAAVFTELVNGIGAGTTELHIVRPFGSTFDPRFILIYFKSPQFLYVGESKMTGTAGQKRVPKDFVSSNPFPLPPLAEQHRIVAKVDELMALCDQLENQHTDAIAAHEKLVSYLLETLTQSQDAADFNESWQRIAANFDILFTTESSIDALKQTLLQLAVMGKLVPQDARDEHASELLKRVHAEKARLIQGEGLKTQANLNIDESEKYLSLPPSWDYYRLGNLAKFIDYRGRTPEKIESGIPLITAKNVRYGFISRDPYEFISEAEYNEWMTRGFPRVNDLLFTTEAPLGNVAIINIVEKFALAQRVICLQLHLPEMAQFVRVLMMSKTFQELLYEQATGMTATGIKASKLKELPIVIPPLAEQHRIVAKVDELTTLCNTLKSRITAANQLQHKIADVMVAQAVA